MENNKTTSTFGGILVLTILALFVIKYFNIAYPISITTSTVSKELSVVGEGKVDAVPDTATVEVGVTVNNAATAQAAQKELTQVGNQIIASLKKIGIDQKDMKTTNVSVYPNYDYQTGGTDIIGYNGNSTLSIKIRKVDTASEVVNEATLAGANTVNGPNFTIDNPDKYREEARNIAIENAKEQAEKLAQNLGIKLGKIVNIIESAPNQSPILYDRGLAAEGMGGGGPSYEPGSQTITSIVTLYFEKR